MGAVAPHIGQRASWWQFPMTGRPNARTLGAWPHDQEMHPMRALRFGNVGDPMKVLHLDDVPPPEPGPGDVRVRMTHRPINPSDLLTIQGLYPVRPDLPGSPG